MPIIVRCYANSDDVLIAWQPAPWDDGWVGFRIERRDEATQAVTVLRNRIPAQRDGAPVPDDGVPSDQSPIRRCLWTDHNLPETSRISYRVTPMRAQGDGFAADEEAASAWTSTVVTSGDAGDGFAAYFNRGTLMSQVVSRFVQGDVTSQSLHAFAEQLATPGFPARRYLSGDARTAMLNFLADADRRGSEVFAAIYEINDEELMEGLKPFGGRGHLLIGNGDGTQPFVASSLTTAGLDVRHRDLSHAGRSSPSVHNKFVVEVDPSGTARRVLTGSTNWTVTGLCTQLNNVLIAERPVTAARFRDQWGKLVAAGDDMPPGLVGANGTPTQDGPIETYFAATEGEAEFGPVRELIAGAKEGVVFLMFMPGNSPLLADLLTLAQSTASTCAASFPAWRRAARSSPSAARW